MDDYTRPTATIDVEKSLELTGSDLPVTGTPWLIVVKLSRPLTDKELAAADSLARQYGSNYQVGRDEIIVRDVDFASFQRNGRQDVGVILETVHKAGWAEHLAEQSREATLQERREMLLTLADDFNPKD